MFAFLKEKLKGALNKFSKKVEEEIVEEPKEKKRAEEKEQKIEKKKEPKIVEERKEVVKGKEKPKKEKKEEKKEEKEAKKEIKEEKKEAKKEEAREETVEEIEEKEPEKKGFFKRIFYKKKAEEERAEEEEIKKEENKEPEKQGILKKISESFTKISLSEQKFDELFWDLEIALLENNVALEVIEKIKEDLKEKLTKEKIPRGNVNGIIISSLKNSIEDLFDVKKIDLISEIKKKKPYVIVFVGVNGSGKTTNLVKFADLCLKNKLKPVIAACDTFRAAAIQQLEEHASRLNVKLIKHDYGADAAAVAYDAIQHAKAKSYDVVLIDTAGRSHSNVNLMDELKKVIRVSKPDFTIFVGDSLTGNDAVEQAKSFNEAVGIDGIILSKTDVDDKGGAFISVSYVTKKPILYIGTGQTYSDIREFNPEIIVKGLGL